MSGNSIPDVSKQNSSFLDSFISNTKPFARPAPPTSTQPPGAAPPSTPPATTASYNEVDTVVSSLDVLLSDGRRVGLQYHLIRPMFLDKAASSIELRCDTYTLHVTGSRLQPLYKALLAGRVTQLEPVADQRFATANRDAVVTKIVLDENPPGMM